MTKSNKILLVNKLRIIRSIKKYTHHIVLSGVFVLDPWSKFLPHLV